MLFQIEEQPHKDTFLQNGICPLNLKVICHCISYISSRLLSFYLFFHSVNVQGYTWVKKYRSFAEESKGETLLG